MTGTVSIVDKFSFYIALSPHLAISVSFQLIYNSINIKYDKIITPYSSIKLNLLPQSIISV